MDRLEPVRQLREQYEAAPDDAERLRAEYHREVVKLHRSGMSLREITALRHFSAHAMRACDEGTQPADQNLVKVVKRDAFGFSNFENCWRGCSTGASRPSRSRSGSRGVAGRASPRLLRTLGPRDR